MLRRTTLVIGTMLLAVAAAACEGPAGPDGAQGPQGLQGPQGVPGENALNTCSDCHDADATMVAIEHQYAASTHGSGPNFERDGSGCNLCHTHQGFMTVVNGEAAPTNIEQPAPVNCRTCHQIHTTYTGDDFALTWTDDVDLELGGVVSLGDGNLCANCHQARTPSPNPTIDGADVAVTSYRFGTHHGPQANVVAGEGLYEFAGSVTYPTGAGPHTATGCNTCHMAEPFGAQAGGHTWAMTYDYHGSTEELVTGCQNCHETATSFAILGDVPAQVETLLGDLETLLRAQGILIDTLGAEYARPGTYSANLAAAYVNWQSITEDRSMGLHFPGYVVALLTNTIEAIQ